MTVNRMTIVGLSVGTLLIGALGVGYWAGHRVPTSSSATPVPSAPSPIPASAPAPEGPAKGLLATADAAAARQQWLEARQTYLQIIREHPETSAAVQAQQRLGALNMRLLFTPSPDPHGPFYTDYTVQTGDTLGRIARQFTTTVELLQKANHLTGDKILAGRTLKVPTVRFSVVVDKSQNLLTLKANEEVLKIYQVSTGKDDQTPVGTFTIVNKLVDPPWYTAQGVIPPSSPDNILGTRWLGFSKPGYGIHGTTDPAAIGQWVTAGCVRMRNAEVEELYAVIPMGTEVTIVD